MTDHHLLSVSEPAPQAKCRKCRRHGDSVHRPVRIFALKEVGVSSGPFQKNLIFCRFVDQNPVRLNVAVSSPDPIPPELVIAVLWRQRFLCKKKVDDSFYFNEVFASLLHTFDILLKLLCLSEIYSSHEA